VDYLPAELPGKPRDYRMTTTTTTKKKNSKQKGKELNIGPEIKYLGKNPRYH
jgi:hypothetical protein